MTVYKAEFMTPGVDTLIFGQPEDNPHVILDDIDGIPGGDVNIYTEKTPFQQGDSYIDTNYSGRTINIVFQIRGNNIATMRNKMHTVLSPLRKTCTLRLTARGDGYSALDERVRDIDCYVSSPPKFIESKGARGKAFLRGIVSFYCPNPFFRSTALETINFADLQGYRTFNILGNAPTDSKLILKHIQLNDLSANKLKKMSTGEFIKTQKYFVEQGATITLDTKFGDKKLYYTDTSMNVTDIWNILEADSRFFQLIPPTEEYYLRLTTELGAFETKVQYYPKWLGV